MSCGVIVENQSQVENCEETNSKSTTDFNELSSAIYINILNSVYVPYIVLNYKKIMIDMINEYQYDI